MSKRVISHERILIRYSNEYDREIYVVPMQIGDVASAVFDFEVYAGERGARAIEVIHI